MVDPGHEHHQEQQTCDQVVVKLYFVRQETGIGLFFCDLFSGGLNLFFLLLEEVGLDLDHRVKVKDTESLSLLVLRFPQ